MIIERIAERIARWIGVYLTTSAVVAAIGQHRAPDPDDLRRLGMHPADFLSLGHG